MERRAATPVPPRTTFQIGRSRELHFFQYSQAAGKRIMQPKFFPAFKILFLAYVSATLTNVYPAPAIKPAGWLATTFLFGVPALVFALLFHWLGPDLWRRGISWWRVFHLLLVLPLALMLLAALLGAALDLRPVYWRSLQQRLRLSVPGGTVWLWAAALSGFMYGGTWADLFAVAVSWFALWKEQTRQKWVFIAILLGTLVKRNAALVQSTLQSVSFFDPSGFHSGFFSHFGPHDFMGIPLQGASWIPVYYAVVMLVCNIGGVELWWR